MEPFSARSDQGLDQADFPAKRARIEMVVDRVVVDAPEVDVRYVMPLTGVAQRKGVRDHTIERDHQHLKGPYQSLRGFKMLHAAQAICAGHGFVRNLPDGFYRLGVVSGDPRAWRPPRLMPAWDEITELLQAD